MEVICILSPNVTIKSHPTDSTKVIVTVGGVDYPLDGHEVITAANAAMNL